MAYQPIEAKRTMIVNVEKSTDDQYVIKVAAPAWNSIQIMMLEGAEARGTTLEFDYKFIKE